MVRACSTGPPGSVLRSLQPSPPSTQHYRPQGPDKHPCRYWRSKTPPPPHTPSHSPLASIPRSFHVLRALSPLPATSTGEAFGGGGVVKTPDEPGSEQSRPISEAVWFPSFGQNHLEFFILSSGSSRNSSSHRLHSVVARDQSLLVCSGYHS